jgi:hypothetical protein
LGCSCISSQPTKTRQIAETILNGVSLIFKATIESSF